MRTGTRTTPALERALPLAALAAMTVLAWAYLFHAHGAMRLPAPEGGPTAMVHHGMEMAMPAAPGWGAAELALAFLMWSVMMIAMMTPSAAPMVVTYVALGGPRSGAVGTFPRTAAFAGGYLIMWLGFSAAATLLQWALQSAGWFLPDLERVTPFAGGLFLVVAGLYQVTPWKQRCLSHCRTPASFLMSEWRDGPRGALAMGLRHGAYCVGCCWSLMLVLFAAGVMNLVWGAILAAIVLIEKALPAGRVASLVFGLLIVGWGAWVLRSSFA